MEREQPITQCDRLLLYAAVLPFPETSKSGVALRWEVAVVLELKRHSHRMKKWLNR